MIKVTIGANNFDRKTVLVESTATPRQVFEENGVDYAGRRYTLNNMPVNEENIDTALADLGVSDRAFLLCVAKIDNATR